MATVFISSSRRQQTAVAVLERDVEALGHHAWFDQELGGGKVWWDQILEQIRAADVFIFDPSFSGRSRSSDTMNYQEMNYQEWMADERTKALAAGRDGIRVTVSDVDVGIDPKNPTQARVVFEQRYEASNYCDVGSKTLDFRLGPDGWKIVAESQPRYQPCG